MAPGNTQVVGRRVAAFLIDLALTWAVSIVAFALLAQRRPRGAPIDADRLYSKVSADHHVYFVTGGRAAAFYAIVLLGGLAYWVVLPGLRGATLGQRILGVRVTGEDGRPPGVARSFVRQLLWIIDGLPWLIPFVVGFITAMVSRGHQRVGDMVARTWVVRAGTQTAAAAAPDAGLLASGLPDPASVPVGIPGDAPPLATGAASVEPAGAAPVAQGPERPAATAPERRVAQPLPAAGWYADPSGRTRLRWWDGARWTDHTAA